MPAATVSPSRSKPEVADCQSVDGLVRKGVSGRTELAIWKRSVAPEAVAAFDRLSFASFEDFRAAGRAARVEDAFDQHIGLAGWAPDACALLKADVNAVVRAVESCERNADYTVRLEHITDDACSKFHQDNTDFRIITTYLGRGTQWAALADSKLGAVSELGRFDVAVFRGLRSRRSDTILHRSPPVQSITEQRLLLVVDVERAAWRARQGGS
jgi:hypothetical protein